MNLLHILLTILKRILFWDRLYPHIINSSLFHLWHQMNAMIASSIYSDPSNGMIIIGVTGTDGKTTTVNLMHHILMQLGQKTVMISTTGVKIGNQDYPNQTKMSSPSPYVLNKILSDAKKSGCTHAVIETTSHGLHQNRFYGIRYTT
jgi:UDP-N-acetylmuramoyl-L-alanyl-D-glutamate--2,6-diaminopimelate ligase